MVNLRRVVGTFQESTLTLRSKGGSTFVSTFLNSLQNFHAGAHWQVTDAVHANASYILTK
ncbi:hypothetical protein PAXINDRAFT_168665 [Paxillus involutus ATCC 200175]|nr:hypothetical protein PAXINDRAFT_168665 [Paxillus involutus ATCC 200175]